MLSGVAIRAVGVHAIGTVHSLDAVGAIKTLRLHQQGLSAGTHALAQTIQDWHGLFPGNAGICVQARRPW